MEALRHGAHHLEEPYRLGGGDAKGPGHPLGIEAEHPADRRRGPEYAGGARDVPADIVMRREHGIADPALHLHAEHQRVDEIRPADLPVLGEGEQHAGNGPPRMNHRAQVRVVKIEDMRADAVDQRGMQRVEPLSPPQHARFRRA